MATVIGAIGAAVTSAATSVGSMFGLGAGAAAGAGASAGAATAASGAGMLTLSKVFSAGSALAAIGQGIAANRQAKTQAEFAEAEALQEEAAGASRARDLAREYAELRGEQQVIQLANGLDIGVGTPVSIEESTSRLAERNLSTTRSNARNRASIARLRKRSLLSEGRASLLGGYGKAAQIGMQSYQLTG